MLILLKLDTILGSRKLLDTFVNNFYEWNFPYIWSFFKGSFVDFFSGLIFNEKLF